MTLRIGLSYRSTSPSDENYERALRAAAARAGVEVALTWLAGHDRRIDLAAADAIDGLVITGGDDVDPAIYRAQADGSHDPDPARDAAEIHLIESVPRVWEVPLLAICRGHQLLNAVTAREPDALVQDLQTGLRHTREAGVDARHEIRVVPGSLLAGVVGECPEVNSSHHQAIGTLADPFTVVATAPDGTIEAYERADPGDKPWLLATQWHPERLEGPGGAGIIDAFLAAVSRETTPP